MHVQLRKVPVEYAAQKRRATKHILLNEDVELGQSKPPIRSIVRSSVRLNHEEQSILAGKLVAKGEATVQFLYTWQQEDGSNGLEQMQFTVPYSQIVDMEHISAGEHTFHAGLQALVDPGAGGDPVHGHAHAARQLIFRDQSHRKEQSITGIVLLCAGNGLSVFVHLCQGDPRQPFLSPDLHHRVAQLQWDPVIVQALDDVPLKAAGIRHQLCHHLHLCALQGHTPGHDESDIAGS